MVKKTNILKSELERKIARAIFVALMAYTEEMAIAINNYTSEELKKINGFNTKN